MNVNIENHHDALVLSKFLVAYDGEILDVLRKSSKDRRPVTSLKIVPVCYIHFGHKIVIINCCKNRPGTCLLESWMRKL